MQDTTLSTNNPKCHKQTATLTETPGKAETQAGQRAKGATHQCNQDSGE